jgi:hypothetical protein
MKLFIPIMPHEKFMVWDHRFSPTCECVKCLSLLSFIVTLLYRK